MMITCPRCQSRYRVAGQDFQQAPARKVRCAACQHVWVYVNEAKASEPTKPAPASKPSARAPSVPSLSTPPETTQITLAPTPKAQRTWALWLGWTLLLITLSGLTVGYTFYRQELTTLWPPLAQVTSLFPLKSAPKPLQILELGHHIRLSPEGRQLIVTGVIENTTSQVLSLPTLHMKLEGPHVTSSIVQTVSLEQDSLEPGERIFFECPGVPIPPHGTTVTLTFKKGF